MNVDAKRVPDAWDDLPDPQRSGGGLSLHEVSETIRRLGLAMGFDPVPEYPVALEDLDRRGRIDWVWLKDGAPVAAFEIEGCNVPTLDLQIRKLTRLGTEHKLIVTYNARFMGGKWQLLKNDHARLQTLIPPTDVTLTSGADLKAWATGLTTRP
jgi:hypothetical protein